MPSEKRILLIEGTLYTIFFGYILLCIVFILPYDSDSWRELFRWLDLLRNGNYDNWPMITWSIFAIFYELFGNYYLYVIKTFQLLLWVSFLIIVRKIFEKNSFIAVFFVVSSIIFWRILVFYNPYLLWLFLFLLSFYFTLKYTSTKNIKFFYFSALFLALAIYAKNHLLAFIPFYFFYSFNYLVDRNIGIRRRLYLLLTHNFKYYVSLFIFILPYLVFNIGYFWSSFWHYPNNWYVVDYWMDAYKYFWHYPSTGSKEYYTMIFGNLQYLNCFYLIILVIWLLNIFKNKKSDIITFVSLLLCCIVPFTITKVPPTYQYLYTFLLLFIIIVNSFRTRYLKWLILLLLIGNFWLTVPYLINTISKSDYTDSAESVKFLLDWNILSRSYSLQPYLNDQNLNYSFDYLEREEFIAFSKWQVKSIWDKYNIKYVVQDNNFNEVKFYNSFLKKEWTQFQFYELSKDKIIYNDNNITVYKL